MNGERIKCELRREMTADQIAIDYNSFPNNSLEIIGVVEEIKLNCSATFYMHIFETKVNSKSMTISVAVHEYTLRS